MLSGLKFLQENNKKFLLIERQCVKISAPPRRHGAAGAGIKQYDKHPQNHQSSSDGLNDCLVCTGNRKNCDRAAKVKHQSPASGSPGAGFNTLRLSNVEF